MSRVNTLERLILGFNLLPVKLNVYVDGKKEKSIEIQKEERLSLILSKLDLKKDKIYKIDLYYKSNNEYLKTELTNVYYIQFNDENILLNTVDKDGIIRTLRKCKDFGIYSGYKKKIIVNETDDYIYKFNNTMHGSDGLSIKNIYVCSKENFDAQLIIQKILKKKYEYDRIAMKEQNDSAPNNFKKVECSIEVTRKKGWFDYLKDLF